MYSEVPTTAFGAIFDVQSLVLVVQHHEGCHSCSKAGCESCIIWDGEWPPDAHRLSLASWVMVVSFERLVEGVRREMLGMANWRVGSSSNTIPLFDLISPVIGSLITHPLTLCFSNALFDASYVIFQWNPNAPPPCPPLPKLLSFSPYLSFDLNYLPQGYWKSLESYGCILNFAAIFGTPIASNLVLIYSGTQQSTAVLPYPSLIPLQGLLSKSPLLF